LFALLPAAAAFAADVPRLSYTKSFPGSVPPWVGITVEKSGAEFWYADWAGGMLWLALPGDEDTATQLRRITARLGGHATLMRASETTRESLPVFEPERETRAGLTRAVKAAFDPHRLFNRDRMFKDC
jgi:glycolate oxidase FAD binding subunit